MSQRHLLLLSNSTLHPTGYLEYAKDSIVHFLKENEVKKVLFIPFALTDQDEYARIAKGPFEKWGFQLESIHEAMKSENPVSSVNKAQAIFIGGGNTFRLLKKLYDNNLVEVIRKRVLDDGIPYIGSSAGTNVATVSINTTNDMPIVYPPTFKALGLVPFNINPHYIDPDPSSTHKGETREQRLKQYHEEIDTPPVLALREGSILHVEGNDTAVLKGTFPARLFKPGEEPQEYTSGTNFSSLLKWKQ